jgi:hypothetical protein
LRLAIHAKKRTLHAVQLMILGYTLPFLGHCTEIKKGGKTALLLIL